MRLTFRSLLLGALFVLSAAGASAQTTKYKCLLQMQNYMGEGAYIVVSLVNAKGEYEKTLYVMGEDKKWYKDLVEWHKFYAKKPADVSAITRASVSGGDRSVTTFELEDAKVNQGYTLRFESAVEHGKYHKIDAEMPLTTEGLAQKAEGKGYIRYVRLSKVGEPAAE